jgi:hypothetical protein
MYPTATHAIPNGIAINACAFWSLNPSIAASPPKRTVLEDTSVYSMP